MFTRLMLSGLMVVGLVGMTQTNAHAWSIKGFNFTGGSLHCKTDGAGGGNLDKNEVNVSCLLDQIVVSAHCQNGGGQDGGLGDPFTVEGSVESFTQAGDSASGRGQWDAEVIHTDAALQAFFGTLDFTGACVNRNWSIIPGSELITSTQVTVKGFACLAHDAAGNCTLFETDPDKALDTLIASCVLGADQLTWNCLVTFNAK